LVILGGVYLLYQITKKLKIIKKQTHYEIKVDSETIYCKHGNYQFSTKKEAIKVATEFKKDPRTHNQNMCEQTFNYWKNQTLTIVKVITIREDLITI